MATDRTDRNLAISLLYKPFNQVTMSNQNQATEKTNFVNVGYTMPAKNNDPKAGKFALLLSLREKDIATIYQKFKEMPEPTKINPATEEPYPKSIMLRIGVSKGENQMAFWSTSVLPPFENKANGAKAEGLDELDDLPF
jgi:hypothetical protein